MIAFGGASAGSNRAARWRCRDAGLPDDRLAPVAPAVRSWLPRPATTPSSARSWSRRSTTCSGSWSTSSSTTAACSRAARRGPTHDAGASSFLYPFLAEGETRSRRGPRRRAPLGPAQGGGDRRAPRRRRWRQPEVLDRRPPPRSARRFEAGGRLLALGNGGSATDAMDVVADFRRRRRAMDAAVRDRPDRGRADPDRGRQRRRRRGDLPAPGDRLRARGRRADRLLDQRRLREPDRGAGGGAAARAS